MVDYLSPDTVEAWRKLFMDAGENFTIAIDQDLLELGYKYEHGMSCQDNQQLIEHCLDLFEWALVSYWRSREWTRSQRRIRQINEGKDFVADEDNPFEKEGVGTSEEQKLWRMGDSQNCLLALNGRINPAKFWLTQHHDVLRFELFIAAGDLRRNNLMIITPMMAQELFVVYDFLNTEQKNTFKPDWSILIEILELAVSSHNLNASMPSTQKTILKELSEHCLFALQQARALEVRVQVTGDRIFHVTRCSKRQTAAADAAILFS